MNKEKMMGDYERTRDVILSCKNMDQLKVGVRMYNQLNKLHSLPDEYLDKLENLIGLMRIKCKENLDEEISNIGKEFKKQAQRSNTKELKNLVFSEDKHKGGKSDDMSIEDISKKHNVDIKDIEKEIRIGTKIEMEHSDSEKEAKEIAMDHVAEHADYYTNPEFGIIAIEDKRGSGRKTIRISKKEMENLHKNGKITVDGVELSYKEDLKEDLDSNEISRRFRDQLKQRSSKRFSKDQIFDELRRRKEEEIARREEEHRKYREMLDTEFSETDDDEIDEATGAASSGSYVGRMNSPIRRTFPKSDIPVTVGGIDKPIGKLYSFDKEVLEEEEIEEATSVASVGGRYATPGFPPSEFMGTAGKKGKARVKKEQPSLSNLGYKKVRVKDECKTFPYCNQSPEAIEIYNEGRVIKTIKKSNLKIKE